MKMSDPNMRTRHMSNANAHFVLNVGSKPNLKMLLLNITIILQVQFIKHLNIIYHSCFYSQNNCNTIMLNWPLNGIEVGMREFYEVEMSTSYIFFLQVIISGFGSCIGRIVI